MDKFNLQVMPSVVLILPFTNFRNDKWHSGEAQVSVWKAQSELQKVFGGVELMRAFATDWPKAGLALRCVLPLSMGGSAQYGSSWYKRWLFSLASKILQ